MARSYLTARIKRNFVVDVVVVVDEPGRRFMCLREGSDSRKEWQNTYLSRVERRGIEE
jgi:hypothetical protein